MLPFRGNRLAASRSNSSSRLPSSTTTRVSSLWDASINIRLVIEALAPRRGANGRACGENAWHGPRGGSAAPKGGDPSCSRRGACAASRARRTLGACPNRPGSQAAGRATFRHAATGPPTWDSGAGEPNGPWRVRSRNGEGGQSGRAWRSVVPMTTPMPGSAAEGPAGPRALNLHRQRAPPGQTTIRSPCRFPQDNPLAGDCA